MSVCPCVRDVGTARLEGRTTDTTLDVEGEDGKGEGEKGEGEKRERQRERQREGKYDSKVL